MDIFNLGGVHGILQIGENILHIPTDRDAKHSISWYLSVIRVFFIVCICWILFRAENIHDAFYVIRHAFSGINEIKNYVINGYQDLQLSKGKATQILFLLGILLTYDYVALKDDILLKISKMSLIYRWGIYYIFVWMIIVWGKFGNNQFVYFQF